MSTELIWQTTSTGSDDTSRLGEVLASELNGGEVIELVADLGGGKTTFTQGLVRGLGSQDKVSSPTFTLKKVYTVGKKQIFHYDFYRLSDPGILKDELAETLGDESIITVIEWSGIVKDILPPGHITIKFQSTPNDPEERQITISYPESFARAIRGLETQREGLEP